VKFCGCVGTCIGAGRAGAPCVRSAAPLLAGAVFAENRARSKAELRDRVARLEAAGDRGEAGRLEWVAAVWDRYDRGYDERGKGLAPAPAKEAPAPPEVDGVACGARRIKLRGKPRVRKETP
jgi:hypothetical protein